MLRLERKRSAGYSLAELMVSSAIMGIIVAYILGFFGSQHKTYQVVEGVAEAQQNMRAIAGLIERDLRGAGYMVHPAGAVCGRDSIGGPDQLFVSDSNAILTVDQLPSDLRSLPLSAEVSGTPGTGTAVSIVVDDLVLDGTATYATTTGGANDTDFNPSGGVILIDIANPDRGVACGLIGSVTVASNTLVVNMTLGLATGATNPADLRLIPAVAYQVITPAGTSVPELQRSGVTFARDVEDLQLAYFYDTDGDGQIGSSPTEYRGESGAAFVPNTIDGNDLREVRFNLVVRTTYQDTDRVIDTGVGQRTENRVNNVPGTDGRRRRIHTATTRIRNIPIPIT